MLLLVGSQATSPITSVTELLVGVTGITAVVLPAVALVAGYLAVAGEREDGTIVFRLGLPDTRLAVLGGKLISRGATVMLWFGAAFAVALAVAIATFGSVGLGVFGRFLIVSTVFVLTNAAVAGTVVSGALAAGVGAISVYFALGRVGDYRIT